MAWESDELRAAVEALLFASDTPVSVTALCDVLPRADAGSIRVAIEELKDVYSSHDGGLQIVQVAGGFHIRTRPEVSHWVERLLRKRRKMRLSQAALETLAIVAYKQPVTKMEMEAIRGVDVGGVLGTLLERNLIAIKGRSKGPGRPLLYATTKEFLDHFGLNDLEDLPSLEELESLLAERDEAAAEGEADARLEESAEVEVEAVVGEKAEDPGSTAGDSDVEIQGPGGAQGAETAGSDESRGAGESNDTDSVRNSGSVVSSPGQREDG